MDLVLLVLLILVVLFLVGGFALSHLLWIVAVIALIVIAARYAMGRRL